MNRYDNTIDTFVKNEKHLDQSASFKTRKRLRRAGKVICKEAEALLYDHWRIEEEDKNNTIQ